jgi:CheY-like chemotaxis protein
MTVAQQDEMPSVLVVDDETMIAMLLEDMLNDIGCKVVGPASSVGQSIALIEANECLLDGAFLDINLRGELVYPVADALMARGVPFMFVTGYALHGIDPQYGAIPALTKPFRFNAIDNAVKVFRQRRRARMSI